MVLSADEKNKAKEGDRKYVCGRWSEDCNLRQGVQGKTSLGRRSLSKARRKPCGYLREELSKIISKFYTPKFH